MFPLTRPSVAQVPVGALHVATTPCFRQPDGSTESDVTTGFSGGHVVAYAGVIACGTEEIRYIVLWQN
jgi:hypothetical protein